MNIENLYNEIQELLPVKRTTGDGDYREELSKAFAKYESLLKDIDLDVKQKCDNWNEVEDRTNKLISEIKSSVKSYYEGLHSVAFTTIKDEMLGNSQTEGIFNSIDLYTVKVNTHYYRARDFDNNNRHKQYLDMFHIPLDKRGIVKTQRYSTPGYPCLYLGNTTYACWEELQRPRFDNLMFSAFKTMKEFRLLDLRTPSRDDFLIEDKFCKIILRLPLIIACSIIVYNDEDDFKPEYIIPQLLIETIISQNREQNNKGSYNDIRILGVMYTSTHINDDFEYNRNVFDNVAIPIIDVSSSSGYCNILSEHFSITNPTCYEYEEIRGGFGIDGGEFGLSEEEKKEQRYKLSKMGALEARMKTFPFYQIPYVIVSEEIVLPATGEPVQVPIRSNTDWSIS